MALIRVRRKRNVDPHNALLVTGALELEEDEAGPSKKARQQDEQNGQPSAFRLIGTLPMPDVRDAARLFLPNDDAQVSLDNNLTYKPYRLLNILMSII